MCGYDRPIVTNKIARWPLKMRREMHLYQLYEEFSFDPSRGLVVRLAALREERVDLIHEDDCRLVAPSNCKQRPHHLLTLTYL